AGTVHGPGPVHADERGAARPRGGREGPCVVGAGGTAGAGAVRCDGGPGRVAGVAGCPVAAGGLTGGRGRSRPRERTPASCRWWLRLPAGESHSLPGRDRTSESRLHRGEARTMCSGYVSGETQGR